MSEQAEKTEAIEQPEDAPESQETDNNEAPEGYEVVVSGDDTPASESVPLPTHLHQKKKWKKEKEQLTSEADERLSAKDREIELLKMQLEQHNADFDVDDIEDDKRLTEDQVRQIWRDEKNREAQAKQQAELERQNDKALDAFYDQAEQLNAEDFAQAEEKFREALGNEAALQMIAKQNNPAALTYALGNNEKKMNYFSNLLKDDPVKFLIELTEFNKEHVHIKPKLTPPPPPDNPSDSDTGSTTSYQQRIDAMREAHAKSRDSDLMRDIMSLKREAREKGVSIE